MKHERELYASVGQGMNERSDCSIRAAATAGCIDYALVHEVFTKHGRKARHATLFSTSRAAIAELFSVEPRRYAYERVTLSEFIRRNPQGHFIVHVRGHALAICDSVIHDWKESPRRIVKCFWRLDTVTASQDNNGNAPIGNTAKE